MRVQIIDLNSLILQYYSLLYFYIVYCNAIKIRKNIIDASLFTQSNDRFCHTLNLNRLSAISPFFKRFCVASAPSPLEAAL